jgi:LPXTG-site transpeptidase (sortase) family protein
VGLYSLWPFPWEEGSAVIDGHFGWINKNPAVFNNLFKLQKWDEIYFLDKKGDIITFIVNKIKIYNQNDATTDIFNSNDWKAHLNIITCEGVWNKTKKSYTNRLVVFSDKLIK